MDEAPRKVTLRLRLSQADAHYGGALVDGARVLALFGDVATELLVRHDGDEGLFRAYDAVVHLHARWPDGRPSQEAVHFREIVDRIRAAGCDAVVQVSTGGAVGMSIDERLGSLVDGAEMGTLNLGTMNFGDDVFVNTRPDIVRIAARLRDRRLVPECEVYDAGMLDTLRWLRAQGHLAAPYHVQFVLGVPGGMSASERNLRFLPEGLPEPVAWTAAGVGRAQLELARALLAAQRVTIPTGLRPRRALRVARALQADLDFGTKAVRATTLDVSA